MPPIGGASAKLRVSREKGDGTIDACLEDVSVDDIYRVRDEADPDSSRDKTRLHSGAVAWRGERTALLDGSPFIAAFIARSLEARAPTSADESAMPTAIAAQPLPTPGPFTPPILEELRTPPSERTARPHLPAGERTSAVQLVALSAALLFVGAAASAVTFYFFG